LLEGVSARGIPAQVVFLTREEDATDFIDYRRFDGIDIDFHIVPAYRLTPWLHKFVHPRRVLDRLARLYNDARQFVEVLKKFSRTGSSAVVYLDRRNIVLAALFKIKGWRTVVRFHGVAGWNRHRFNLSMLLRQPLYFWALKAPFDLVLSSEDGSPVQPFFDRYLAANTPYRVFVNGVDLHPPIDPLAKPLRDRYGFSEAWPVLLFVSRLTPDKGAQEFLDALIETYRRNPRFYVVIVAGGSDPGWAKDVLESAGMGARVAFECSLPHTKILTYFRQADVFVSSNFLANLTNTVLEAMAAGICVVMLGRDQATQADISTEALVPDDVVVRIPRFSGASGLSDALTLLVENTELIDVYRSRMKDFAGDFLRPWEERISDEIDLLECIASDRMPSGANRLATGARGSILGS